MKTSAITAVIAWGAVALAAPAPAPAPAAVSLFVSYCSLIAISLPALGIAEFSRLLAPFYLAHTHTLSPPISSFLFLIEKDREAYTLPQTDI